MKIKHLVLSLIAVVAIGCNSDDDNTPAVIEYGCFNGISVNSQAALDSVAKTIGPDCNSMDYLILGNDSVASDINSLASLKKIEGIKTIKIQNCPMLTSLEGLHNVRETISIEISETGITDLRGLRSLKTIIQSTLPYSEIYLHNNDALVSLNGLQKLTTIPDLNIGTCNALKSFHGLEKCKEADRLEIINCPALTSFPTKIQINYACYFSRTGIINLNGLKIASGASVTLYENPSLSSLGNAFKNIKTLNAFHCNNNPSLVSLEGLESLTTVTSLTIIYNASLKNLCALVNFMPGINPGSPVFGNDNPVTLSTINSGNCSVE